MAALVLLSGGLDSTVAAALYRASGADLALGLWVDYGQRAGDREARAARAVGAVLGLELVETRLPLLAAETRTALVDRSRELPRPDPALPAEGADASAAAVWVPNRNGLLVNLAAALAEARGLDDVVVGFNAEEAATFPDNGPGFLEAVNASLAASTRATVRVVAPCLHLDKPGLLAAGLRVGAPVGLTWSCYEGGEDPCGRCESCRRRQRAEAGCA